MRKFSTEFSYVIGMYYRLYRFQPGPQQSENDTYNTKVINADLHCHTRASDGSLNADTIVEIAHARGINLLAITDHDTVANVSVARAEAKRRGVGFVSGVEISAQWHDVGIHVVGLNLDETNAALLQSLSLTRKLRNVRAIDMGRDLEISGIRAPYEGAMALATNPDLISRTHFARYLVSSGACSSMGDVFNRFMKPGKPGYVEIEWTSLQTCVDLIHNAGGDAVLAHAARYDCGAHGGTEALVKAFKAAGGDALEVVCSGHSPSDWATFAALCRKFDLRASIGSDFHSHAESKVKIGDLPRLSPSLVPVWQGWPQFS
jgi:3',5'-nucleoside bisphosphate phosphatase